MEQIIEFEEEYKGFKIVGVLNYYDAETREKLRGRSYIKDWRCGYCAVPSSHPAFGKDYIDVNIDVHGGLTYGRDRCPMRAADGLWWFGFDCAHSYDTIERCTVEYVLNQCKLMALQFREMANNVETLRD